MNALMDLIDASGDCWLPARNTQKTEYHRVRWQGKPVHLHRLVYEQLVGPIPDGLHIDHLCRNQKCCNPDHLEPVTRSENLRRGKPTGGDLNMLKTHCPSGHEYESAGVRGGKRLCRECRKAYMRSYNKGYIRPSRRKPDDPIHRPS